MSRRRMREVVPPEAADTGVSFDVKPPVISPPTVPQSRSRRIRGRPLTNEGEIPKEKINDNVVEDADEYSPRRNMRRRTANEDENVNQEEIVPKRSHSRRMRSEVNEEEHINQEEEIAPRRSHSRRLRSENTEENAGESINQEEEIAPRRAHSRRTRAENTEENAGESINQEEEIVPRRSHSRRTRAENAEENAGESINQEEEIVPRRAHSRRTRAENTEENADDLSPRTHERRRRRGVTEDANEETSPKRDFNADEPSPRTHERRRRRAVVDDFNQETPSKPEENAEAPSPRRRRKQPTFDNSDDEVPAFSPTNTENVRNESPKPSTIAAGIEDRLRTIIDQNPAPAHNGEIYVNEPPEDYIDYPNMEIARNNEEKETKNKIIIESKMSRKKKNNFETYTCIRKRSSLTEKYTFLLDKEVLFAAKRKKQLFNQTIFITEGDDCSISGNHQYMLTAKGRIYQLIDLSNNRVLMQTTCETRTERSTKGDKSIITYTRYFTMEIYLEDGRNIVIHSEMPHKNSHGNLVLKFTSFLVINSRKNSIMRNMNNNRSIVVYKSDRDNLQTLLYSNPNENITPLYAFAHTLITWIDNH